MLRRDKIDLVYEFTIYNPVNPPWRTPDTKGQWLADHTPPRCVLYLPGPHPQLLIGSAMAEGAHGLVCVDAEGVKLKGKSCFVGFAGAGIGKGHWRRPGVRRSRLEYETPDLQARPGWQECPGI